MSSWWDSSNFSSLASQAFKNAQKKIDKVLDIEETESSKRRNLAKQKLKEGRKQKQDTTEEKESDGGDFWSTWMSPSKPTSSESDDTATTPSSWNLPWGSSQSEVSEVDEDKEHEIDEDPPASEPSVSATHRLFPSKGSRSLSSETELDSNEGLWMKDSGSVLEGSSIEKDDDYVSRLALQEEIIEDGVDAKQGYENVHYPELKGVAEDSGNLHTPELVAIAESDSQPVMKSAMSIVSENLSDVEGFRITQSSGIQELSTASSSSWDISDSVIKLLDNNEKPCDCEVINVNAASEILGNVEGVINVSENDENIDADHENFNTSGVLPEKQCDNIDNSILIGENPHTTTSTPVCAQKAITEGISVAQLGDSDDQKIKNVVNERDSGECQEHNVATDDFTQSLQSEDVTSPKEVDVDVPASEMGGLDKKQACIIQSGDESDSQMSQASGMMQDYVNVSFGAKELPFKQKEEQSLSDLELLTSATSSEFEATVVDPSSSTGSSDAGRLDSSADTVVATDIRILQEGNTEDSYSLFGEMKYEEEVNKSNFQVGDTVSPASSFVKCMLEEAMEESCKEDSGSDNHSSGSKSESSKLDSEFEKSIHSGQESSDDIETTTSSDIEIISATGLCQSDKQFAHAGFDLPALKICVQQRSSNRERHNHQQFDSHSSSSTQSKCGDHDELSPERGEVHTWRDAELQHADLESVQEEGDNNPYHPERLLKKLAEMAEVLQARETKLVSVSKDNHQLVEDVAILRSQLHQSEEARETETADLKAITDEFTLRIGESEKKLQNVIREKETLKQQLDAAKAELERRSQNTDVELLLEEKTEQVELLMKEGEKLSKQQLQNSTIIKKLRAKEKEFDGTVTSQKKKIEDQAAELERLKTVLDSKDDMESKQADAINQLNAAVQKQDQDHSKALSDLEDAQEKNRGLQTAVDKAYKEIAELHRSNASHDSKAQEAALSKETSLREEMKMTLEREQQRFRQERETFIMQADDLRLDMTRLEKEHNRREDLLREEISHLQERLQQDEARSQDISQSITSATRPLLRQIENLQATFGAQSTAWEKVEKNLTDRLAEAQIALAIAQDKERTACESEMESKAKTTSLESANARLKQDKAQLLAQKESDQLRLEELQDARTSFIAQLETNKQSLNHELTQVKTEKVHLESQLALEANKLENEKKKSIALEEQMHMMEKERPKSRGTPSPSPSMSISRQESLMGSFYERNSPGMNLSFSEDLMDNGSEVRSSTKTSVYENLRQSGATIVMENLQSQLKLREGEISHLQSEIAQLERTRESMARELVNLSNQNDELKENMNRLQQMEEEHKELNNRYSAILLMYGEKEEQVQELRLDLQDVKEMYKSQIDALLAK